MTLPVVVVVPFPTASWRDRRQHSRVLYCEGDSGLGFLVLALLGTLGLGRTPELLCPVLALLACMCA